MASTSAERCRQCGAVLIAGSPGGLCAKCLLTLGLTSSDILGEAVGNPEVSAQQHSDDAAVSTSNRPAAPELEGLVVPLSEKPGDRIGRYNLIERIGEGGFGVVYKADQKEPVKRTVALKIIKLGMDTEQVVARFETERYALALMDHPNIAKIIDAGATETGRPYFVMELVQGTRITDYCVKNHLSIRQRLELFIRICRAIQHAHQKGVIHRDLKPSNVLVTLHDGVPVPKVIDFGIAKATEAELTEQTAFTHFGQFLGTPAYMSPEQAEMTGIDVDTRTDIYSLGVLLYELLTGCQPFDTKEFVSHSLDEIRRTIRDKRPPPPSTRLSQHFAAADLRSPKSKPKTQNPRSKPDLARQLRGDLDCIVMKCLEKDRTRRYETASGLARDVERHLNHEPVVARPPSRLYEFRRTVRRHKFGFAATAAIIAALACGTIVSSLEAVRAKRAERAQGRLLGDAQRAKQDATEKLWGSYLAEAQGRRRSGETGQRFDSLVALSNAAAIRPSLDLRNEAIACLALVDIRRIPGGEKKFKRGHQFGAMDPAFKRYVIADDSGAATIRRLSDDSGLAQLPSFGNTNVAAPFFSPDGKLLAILRADQMGRVYNSSNLTILLELTNMIAPAFTLDSEGLVVRERDGLALYDLATATRVRSFPEQLFPSPLGYWTGPFSSDGQLLPVYLEGHTNISILNLRSGSILTTLHHPRQADRMAWHPDSIHVAVTCYDNLIYIWDVRTGQIIRALQGHQNTPVSVLFNHDGTLLASCAWDVTTRLWDFQTGRQLVSMPFSIFLNYFSPDDRTLAVGGWDNESLDFLQVEPRRAVRTIHERERALGPTGTAIFSTDGNYIAYPTEQGLRLWDVRTSQNVGFLPRENTSAVYFNSEDENLLFLQDYNLFRSAVKKEGESSLALGAPRRVSDDSVVSVSTSGRYFASTSTNGCRILRSDTMQEQTQLEQPWRWDTWSISFSSDDRFVAGAFRWQSGAKVWDAHTGKLLKELPTEDNATLVLFKPNTRILVVAGSSEICFWDTDSWEPTLHIKPLADDYGFPLMTFSADGTIFACVRSSKLVRLYDASNGRVLAELEPPNPWMITSLSFNPDATLLAVCEGRDALHLWDLRYLREQLKPIGLDWDLPPYPPRSTGPDGKP